MVPDTRIHLAVVEAYDRWSSFYDCYDNPMVFGASRIVQRLAENVAGQDVIELGCGTGRNLERLKRKGAAKVIGCDISAGMLEQARARDAELTLLQQDMTQPLPLADGSADLILFSLALEHVGDLTSPLREAGRLLRPAGKIAVIEIHPFLSLGNVAAHFHDGGTVVQMPTFPHPFSDYINATTKSGLIIAECREWLPRDFQAPVPEKVLKRGPECPLLVEFSLCRGHSERRT
jgi:malonyl-CoA O-methyltransferase